MPSDFPSRRRPLPNTRSLIIRLLGLLAVLVVASYQWAPSGLSTRLGLAEGQQQFIETDAVVVLSDRPVCSLLGEQKLQVGIRGQDGSDSTVMGGVAYWGFGDTVLADGRLIANVLGASADLDAGDCIDLTPTQKDGKAVPLLPSNQPEELTVWPNIIEATGPDRAHIFYLSVKSDDGGPWWVAGSGIASFDSDTLLAERQFGGKLIWTEGMPMPGGAVVDGDTLYILLNTSREELTTDVILARVPVDLVESLASYEYWQPGAPGQPGVWLSGLWDEGLGAWDPAINDIGELWRQPGMHNGVEMAYNQFLEKWLAVYSANFLTSVKVRAADDITGPWDGPESTLIDCGAYRTQGRGFLCYGGAQHLNYERDGGRTIYVTYSNSETYQVYLHEVRLAAPIVQWSDGAGRALYLASQGQGPIGFSADGVSFYASDIPVPGFTPIHLWIHQGSGTVELGATAPSSSYADAGVAFFAPIDAAAAAATNVSQAPVYRWSKGSIVRYSPLDLSSAGFIQGEVTFYSACPDTDNNALTDCEESFSLSDESDGDRDGDRLTDAFEESTPGCDPFVFNEDDLDGIGLESELELGLNPCVWDTGGWGCVNAEVRDPGCDVDSDGDGCPDAWELGPSAASGGQRDPNYYWDFFDVPNALNQRDGAINLVGDVLRIIARFGANDAAGSAPINRYTDPTAPVPPVGYHPAFDRSDPPPGSDALHLGPPDGAISIHDIMRLLRQFGHSCSESAI